MLHRLADALDRVRRCLVNLHQQLGDLNAGQRIDIDLQLLALGDELRILHRRVDAIRKAFDATMKDPEFIAECEKLKIDIDPLTGVQVSELLVKIYKTPADTVERVRKSMEHK